MQRKPTIATRCNFNDAAPVLPGIPAAHGVMEFQIIHVHEDNTRDVAFARMFENKFGSVCTVCVDKAIELPQIMEKWSWVRQTHTQNLRLTRAMCNESTVAHGGALQKDDPQAIVNVCALGGQGTPWTVRFFEDGPPGTVGFFKSVHKSGPSVGQVFLLRAMISRVPRGSGHALSGRASPIAPRLFEIDRAVRNRQGCLK